MHLNKGQGGNPANRILGGVGYVTRARAAFVVARDPGDAERRRPLPVKNNLSRAPKGRRSGWEDLPGQEADKLIRDHLGSLGKEDQDLIRGQLYRPVWLGPVEVSAEDALAQSAKGRVRRRWNSVPRGSGTTWPRTAAGLVAGAGGEEGRVHGGQPEGGEGPDEVEEGGQLQAEGEGW